jgi:hypothetical protein
MKQNSLMTRRRAVQIMGMSTIVTAIPFPKGAEKESMNASNVRGIKERSNFFTYRSIWHEFDAMKQFLQKMS